MPELHHPDLPGRVITVNDRAVKIHRKAGWVLAETDDATADSGSGSATELPAEPVETEQASDPLNLTEGD